MTKFATEEDDYWFGWADDSDWEMAELTSRLQADPVLLETVRDYLARDYSRSAWNGMDRDQRLNLLTAVISREAVGDTVGQLQEVADVEQSAATVQDSLDSVRESLRPLLERFYAAYPDSESLPSSEVVNLILAKLMQDDRWQ